MPTYDYHCQSCGLDFEVEQTFAEATLSKCPTKKSGRSPEGCAKSGRGRVVKVFSPPGITFKGSGFYKNDSRPGASKSSTSSTGSSQSSTGSEGSTKTDNGSSSESPSKKSADSSSSASKSDSTSKPTVTSD